MVVEDKEISRAAIQHGLSDFGLRGMIECGRGIRDLATNAGSMEEAARLLVRYFRRTLANQTAGHPDCVLVRCFKTHTYQRLPAELQTRARALLSHRSNIPEDLPCLTLLATAGDLQAWNSRATSEGHAVIPLESVEVVERAPMIAQLIQQMGLEISSVLAPTEELLLQAEDRVYGVFHVPEAAGSPSIPSQQGFILKYGIKSVLGFGGLLPSGELFAMIMFSRVAISRETASLFRTLALSVKLVLLPFTRGPVFADEPPVVVTSAALRTAEQEHMRSEIATLNLLLPALEDAAMHQTDRLEDVVIDLKLRAEEVEKLGARLGSMLESTSDAVFLLDREWRFTYLNRHAKALLETGQDLLGRNIWEEFPAAVDRTFWNRYHTAMQDRVFVEFQEHYPAPLDRWFDVHAFPSDHGIAVFFHDVTDRRKADAALIESEKLAVVGRLAASIAHEVNNPLESVTNLIYLARNSVDMQAIHGHLDVADRELRRAAAITSQTLRFHRQLSGPMQVTSSLLFDDVLSIYLGRLVNSHVTVERRERARRPLMCFEGEIRQVLNNLVGNAIDAMHPAGGKLMLRSREATDWKSGERGWVITLADTGSGMSTQTKAKSFEPFYSTKGLGGTGLGLWISREIVSRHNGRISFRSCYGGDRSGTVFTLFLPFAAAVRQPPSLS